MIVFNKRAKFHFLYFPKNMQKLWLWTRKLTWPQTIQTTLDALEIGYRHIDTARIYKNEKEIWTAIKQSWLPRTEIKLTTKLWFDYIPNYKPHQFKNEDFLYTQRESKFNQSLENLQTEYIDEILLHRPTTLENDIAMLTTLLTLQTTGKIKQIWVANFPLWYLQQLPTKILTQLSCNQIEVHPFLFSQAMHDFVQEKKLTITAYSPLAHGKILNHPVLHTIAEKKSYKLWKTVSVAQICIARCLSFWYTVIPKTTQQSRLQENREAQDIQLEDSDFEAIAQLPKHHRYCNPPFAPQWDI